VAERREELRAADVDRTFVAERLKAALDEGRLSLSEYDERLKQTYEAKTYGDLDKIMLDLPHPVAPEHSQVATSGYAATPTVADVGRTLPTWLRILWTVWLVAVSVNVVTWLLVSVTSQSFIYPWPIWVAGPWGAVLLALTLSGVGRGVPYRYAERYERRQAYRQARRERRGRY
jgi:hypothetical protein